MNLWLCGRWELDERDVWADALRAELPARHRLLLQRGEIDDAQIDVAIVANPAPGSLGGLPGLRMIQSLWAGVERLLDDPTLPVDVPVVRMVDPAMNAAMAETALWAVLCVHRGFFECARQQQAGRWQALPQRRADEVSVLVLGYGQMGRAAASRIAQIGYPVTAWSRHLGHDTEGVGGEAGIERTGGEAGIERITGEAALCAAAAHAGIVVNLLPLTAQTRGLLGERFFAWLPPGAAIVNLARGAHVVQDELLAALASGRIGQAVLDVFDVEPLPAGHPYWTHPRVTVLPHMAAQTDPRSAAQVVVRNLEALEHGAPLVHRADRRHGY